MNPVFNAIIPAAAALLGVLLGNFLQARRELAKWRLERDAQRVRDREQWSREDQLRFVQQKREIYAEFILKLDGFADLVYDALSYCGDNPAETDAGERREDAGWTTYERGRTTYESAASAALIMLRLIAPVPVSRAAMACVSGLGKTMICLRFSGTVEQALEVGDIDKFSLIQLMRQDLGEVPEELIIERRDAESE